MSNKESCSILHELSTNYIIDENNNLIQCAIPKEIEIVGRGSYGVVKQCSNDKVVKESESSLHRELKFIDTMKEHKNNDLLKMYKIARAIQIDDRKIAMEKMDTTLNNLELTNILLLKTLITKLSTLSKNFHKSGFSHNDIKPANIGVNNKKGSITLKLIDLGSTIHENENNTGENTVATTILYRPIVDVEIFNHEFNKKADNWAIGCTIFELVVSYLNPIVSNSVNRYLFGYDDSNRIPVMIILIKMKADDLKDILGILNTTTPNRGLTEGKFAKYVKAKKMLFSNAVANLPELNNLGTTIFNLMYPIFTLENDKNVINLRNAKKIINQEGSIGIFSELDSVINGAKTTKGGNYKSKKMNLTQRCEFEKKMNLDSKTIQLFVQKMKQNRMRMKKVEQIFA